MKKLIIVRHAHALWGNGVKDIERELSDIGVMEATNIGIQLSESNTKISLIIHSSAKRTTQTAILLNKSLKLNEVNIQPVMKLYLASDIELLKHIAQLNNNISKVMIIAHNPGITDLINYLTNRTFDALATASVTKLDFDTDDWESINDTNCMNLEI